MTTDSTTGAPTVVLVPGLGLDARAWTRVAAGLRPARSHVVLLPALGRRPVAGEPLDVVSLAGGLLDELSRRSLGTTVLVGHSASCPVVVEAALRSAEVVGLVLLGPVTDPRAATWPRMLGQWARTAMHERPWEGPELVPQYARTGLPGMVRGMTAIRAYRTDHALGRVGVPVVALRGATDRIAAAGWLEDLGRAGARVVTTAGAAHMLPLTHPDVVVAAIRQLAPDLDPGLRLT